MSLPNELWTTSNSDQTSCTPIYIIPASQEAELQTQVMGMHVFALGFGNNGNSSCMQSKVCELTR